MKRSLTLLTLATLLLPGVAFAAPAAPSFSANQDLFIASSTPGNRYLAGGTITITAPSAADLSALAGSIVIGAPIAGDALLAAGSIDLRSPLKGDLRALAGHLQIKAPVSGDVVAFGGSVDASVTGAHNVFIIAANTTLSDGADGPVVIYGNNIALDGDFAGDVRVVALGRVSLGDSTHIHGAFTYEAPEEALISPSAVIDGGAKYTGASYLPSTKEARTLAFVSVGVFLIVKIISALILAGLFAGLFPRFSQALAKRAFHASTRSVFLTILLGFALLVATPALLLLLAVTFVGIGLAILLAVAYSLLIGISLVYAGILVGVAIAERFEHRTTVLWRDGLLGMFLLSLVALVPYVGAALVLLLTTFSMGACALLFFHAAFPHTEVVSQDDLV